MSRRSVQVEIFAAGDGINYPQKLASELSEPCLSLHDLVHELEAYRRRKDKTSTPRLTTGHMMNSDMSRCKGQTVTVHYTGYLEDGTQFDSSRYRGKPFKFKLGSEQVVPGLDEGVSQLSIGERAKVTIPAALAYGARGFPGLVPPNSALVFDLELITFN